MSMFTRNSGHSTPTACSSPTALACSCLTTRVTRARLFDEHNHPVNKKQEQAMTKAQRDRCRWRRFYKAVLLLHCDAAGERFLVAGVARVAGRRIRKRPCLWPLLDTFLAAVGSGMMKVLLVDRGFINGPKSAG